MSSIQAILWPALGSVFLLSAILCLFVKRWAFGIGLLIPGTLLIGSWCYDRAHEKVSKFHVALLEKKLVREDREHPEKSIYYVDVTALEMGNWRGKLRAADMHDVGTPGTIVVVEIGEHPLTGSYIKSMARQNYGKPPPRYTYIPPPKGEEFQYVFHQPLPPNVTVERVISEYDHLSAKIALAFRIDRATFERLRPANLEPVPFDSFGLGLKISTKKEVNWWRPATAKTEIWGRNTRDGKKYVRTKDDHFDTEQIVLTWDEDGLVQYFWFGGGLRTDR
jgi:hypothetical protein